jgi:hypothetical protein
MAEDQRPEEVHDFDNGSVVKVQQNREGRKVMVCG